VRPKSLALYLASGENMLLSIFSEQQLLRLLIRFPCSLRTETPTFAYSWTNMQSVVALLHWQFNSFYLFNTHLPNHQYFSSSCAEFMHLRDACRRTIWSTQSRIGLRVGSNNVCSIRREAGWGGTRFLNHFQ